MGYKWNLIILSNKTGTWSGVWLNREIISWFLRPPELGSGDLWLAAELVTIFFPMLSKPKYILLHYF